MSLQDVPEWCSVLSELMNFPTFYELLTVDEFETWKKVFSMFFISEID